MKINRVYHQEDILNLKVKKKCLKQEHVKNGKKNKLKVSFFIGKDLKK
jgi:hypothetical protein